MSARDREYERAFLDQAEVGAGLMGLGFPDQVLERLDAYGNVYGDRFVTTPLRQLLKEVREEGIDSAAWGVLLSQRILSSNGDFSEEQSIELRVALQKIAGHGAAIENLCRQVAVLLAE